MSGRHVFYPNMPFVSDASIFNHDTIKHLPTIVYTIISLFLTFLTPSQPKTVLFSFCIKLLEVKRPYFRLSSSWGTYSRCFIFLLDMLAQASVTQEPIKNSGPDWSSSKKSEPKQTKKRPAESTLTVGGHTYVVKKIGTLPYRGKDK